MKLSNTPVVTLSLVTLIALAASACTPIQSSSVKPLVTASSIQDAGLKPSVAPLAADTANGAAVASPGATQVPQTITSVTATVTLDKSQLFNRKFLYGFDLQYSSQYDKDMDLYNQSMALGHIPSTFRIDGNELELIADQTRLYPSDVNHPEMLISRFDIVKQDSQTITIQMAHSGIYLVTQVGTAASTVKDSWVRSFDYDPSGDYLLQQTSVMLNDGTIAEFMESIFPAENLTPSAGFQQFTMDPSKATGGNDRYLMLPGESIYKGETQYAMAEHFDIGTAAAPKTINWYVTPNAPDEYLDTLRMAVEGWNRYFVTYQGISRKVVHFVGRLPDGIHIGDPRYNVINWDSRLVAGAAYETQATDPFTGMQSHSLIYMPAAWVQIGLDYWKNGQYMDPSTVMPAPSASSAPSAAMTFMAAHTSCLRDVREGAALLASGRFDTTNPDDLKTFGKELLKQTLFHEVGHSFGLHHNFKGSLSYDRSKPDSIFSYSIMDYNDFEIERAAFSGPDTADGPLLEYDRQAIDFIYNQGKDVAASAPVIPACNDQMADTETDGVDPLCIRYDAEKDPTLSVTRAFMRIDQDKLDNDSTLTDALDRVTDIVLTPSALSAVKSADDLNALTTKLSQSITGALNFYIVMGRTGILRTVYTNAKSLLEFEKDVLPQGYVAGDMRARSITGVKEALALFELPANVLATLKGIQDQIPAKLSQAAFIASLPADQVKTLMDGVNAQVAKTIQGFSADDKLGLPAMRATLLSKLGRHPAVPFFLEPANDYEAILADAIADVVSDAATRTPAERKAAALALQSYSGRDAGDTAIKAVAEKLNIQLKAATNNADRELAIALIKDISS